MNFNSVKTVPGWQIVCSIAALLTTSPVLATETKKSLIELGDVGPTVDVTHYVSRWHTAHPTKRSNLRTKNQTTLDFFPVLSPSLTPGQIVTREHTAAFLQNPLCVVGDDPFSLAWIAKHKDLLHRAGAMCIATNLAAISSLNDVRLAIAPVPVFAVSADDLLARVGVRHYPVLITRTRVEQ